MKTMLLAAAAVLAVGTGAAFANEGGPHANTWFTELPGVVAHAPAQVPSPNALATNGMSGTYVTGHSPAVSVFQNHNEGGANN